MAYAALLSLTRTLDNILFFSDKWRVLDKCQELQIKSLHQKLGLFISFLEETSQKNSDSIEGLEEIIRDAVYEAEDVIESHMSNQILSRYESKNYEDKYEKEDIHNVMEKLDSIWGEVEKINDKKKIEAMQIKDPLIQAAEPVKVESTSEIEEVEKMHLRKSSSSKSTSTNISAPVVGFETDMRQIKELLAGSSTKLETISIVGMGGIGKTTLAQNIYNDSFVKRRFDIRAWTTVSQKYDVVELIEALLRSTGELTHEMDGQDTEELKLKLYQNLKQRRYCIVMDDVWDTDFLKEFKQILPDDNNGSRIIMTSRSSQVTNFGDNFSHVHQMNFLSPEQSWNLLCHKALGEEPCALELEEIGRKITEKCKGLPLTLAVIGGLLNKGKKTEEYWKYVEENMKSVEAGNYDDVIQVLSWSYNHLPYHLKACFLYMAVFPEDYVINVSHLIWLWLAEGFVKPISPENLEHVAKEYLEDLISRNLIVVHNRNYYGEIKTCTMHDLLRILCTRKAWEKMFLYVAHNDVPEVVKSQRYLSIHQRKPFSSRHRYHPIVRTLLYFEHVFKLPRFSALQLLRVFDACRIWFKEFPIEIIKLVNLRYLAFSLDAKCEIPASIAKLCNLETLIVIMKSMGSKARILYLPSGILKMQLLRRILVRGCSFLPYCCGERNENLQVLSGLINFSLTKEITEKIINLKTLGTVYYYDLKTNWSFYCLENVVHMYKLENLKFKFIGDGLFQLPLDLCFPQNLKKLTLIHCKLSWNQMSMIGSLPSLQVLKLKRVLFEKYVWKTNEGEFSKLKFLHLQDSWLKHWEVEETHFPCLECLSLRGCRELKCIPPGFGAIPYLRDIVLYKCRKRVVDSANEILKEQHEYGNESLQIHDGSKSGVCIHRSYFASQWRSRDEAD